jgi:mannose-1-phosphate guanylyltransferase/phosphomannomutase
VLTDQEALLTLVMLVSGDHEGARIALPVSASRAAEDIATRNGAEIVWTKVSSANLMDVAAAQRVALGADQDGGFIFPSFLPAFDATAAFVNVLELLAHADLRISKIVSDLASVHMAHESVVTPWEEKGVVMRKLVERVKDRDVLLVDGVKVSHGQGWALVLPDPDEPLTHVWAEADTEAEARGLVEEYARRIRLLLR